MEELMEIMLTHLDVINSLVVLQRESFMFEIVQLVFITTQTLIDATGNEMLIVLVSMWYFNKSKSSLSVDVDVQNHFYTSTP